MYAKILMDEKARKGLISGKGFSTIIDGRVLFDVGEDVQSLFANIQRMKVDVSKLECIVISHEHWDHIAGLWEILKINKGLTVYAPPSVSETFIECIKESGGTFVAPKRLTRITEGIYVTKEIKFVYKEKEMSELSLIVEGDNGISIVTGCAHPGIERIIKYVQERFADKDVYLAFGGFHLRDMNRDELGRVVSKIKELGVLKIGPMHCSGEKARKVIRGQFPGNYISGKAGQVIHL